jgi:hypothetical protein
MSEREHKDNPVIKQIIAADNWWAIFSQTNEVLVAKLACWALTTYKPDNSLGDNTEVEYVEGLDAVNDYVDFVHDADNFLGYVYAQTEQEAKIKGMKLTDENRK